MSNDLVVPQEEVERWLVATWAELLELSSVSAEDDFFAVGGTSLHAMEIIVRLREEFGIAVSTSILIEHSTPRSMAAAVLNRVPEADLPHRHRYGIGTALAMFCVHGNMSELVAHLPSNLSVHMLPPHGLDGNAPPRTFAEMTADYLRRIRSIQPEGPYIVAGYSFGGVIAHAVACELKDEGSEVDLLMILDSADPVATRPDARRLARLDDLERRIADGGPLVDRAERHELSLAGASRAAGSYEARRFDGDIVYFRATGSDMGDVEVWRDRCTGELRVIDVPGDHFSMLAVDNAAVFARSISGVLRDALGDRFEEAGALI